MGVKQHKHSIENQINPIIKINSKKIKTVKERDILTKFVRGL